MRPVLVVDVFESQRVADALAKTLHVERMNLVHIGVGDFYWVTDHRISLEHKSMEQVIAEMGGRLDNQLRKHTQHAEEVGLVIDGLATPRYDKPGCHIWRKAKAGTVFVKHRTVNTSYEALQAYLWRLDKEGITVYQAPDVPSLCSAISAFVFNSLKDENKSLRRYVKTKPIVWEPNPLVETLIGISGAKIGEATAKSALEYFVTPYRLFNAEKDEIVGVLGEVTASRILRAIGRAV